MGLDISLYKVIPLSSSIEELDNFFILEEFPELKMFEHLSFEKINEYFDLAGDLSKKGYILEELEYLGTAYGEIATYNFEDKNHELFEAHKWLESVWNETYFLDRKELCKSEYFKIFKKKYYDLLVKYGWKGKYKFYASGNDTNYYNLVAAQNFAKDKVKVSLENPTTFNKTEKCITFKEISYQRKGANKLFYDNNIWNHPCITDLKTLEEHSVKYFSQITRAVLLEKYAENLDSQFNQFKERILDKFVEGEMFVIYH